MIGIRYDGSVISLKEIPETKGWTDIVCAAAYCHPDYETRPVKDLCGCDYSYEAIVGVRKNGLLSLTCDRDGSASGWKNLAEVYSYVCFDHAPYLDDPVTYSGILGLHKDGTVSATGLAKKHLAKWQRIRHLKINQGVIMGFTADGILEVADILQDKGLYQKQVEEKRKSWSNIVDADYAYGVLFGLGIHVTLEVAGHDVQLCNNIQFLVNKERTPEP